MYEQALASLKEAFPTVDPVVVEAILDSHNGQAEACFEPLLRISDPSYKPDPPQRRPSQPVPSDQPAQTTPEPQQPEEPLSPEEQMRRDEEFARQLALEDERERVRLYRQQQQRGQNQQQQRRPSAPERVNSQGMLSSFEQEIPVIKERMIEAGTAAKNKMMQWYNQMKESSQQSSNQNTMPPTNAQYRGLSRDDRDDLLSGDMSALHLSENDVYTRTTGQVFPQRQQNASDSSDWDDRLERRRPGGQTGPNVIQVNPPAGGQRYKTSTSIDQLNADEELARRLAYEESYDSATPPPMPARPKSQSPPAVSPIHSPVQNFSESPRGSQSPFPRTIEVNPDYEAEEEVVAKPYTISTKATPETHNEPAAAKGNKKDLLDVDDDDIGLVDVDDEEEEEEGLDHVKATKPDEKA